MPIEIVLFRYMLRSIDPCNNSLLRDVPKAEYIEKTITINTTRKERQENLFDRGLKMIVAAGTRRPLIVNRSPLGRPYGLKIYRWVRFRALRLVLAVRLVQKIENQTEVVHVYKENITSEIEDAIRRIQLKGGRKSDVRFMATLCLICGQRLSRKEEELGYGRCSTCRDSLSKIPGPEVPLIISVDGKSTLDKIREDWAWVRIERNLRRR